MKIGSRVKVVKARFAFDGDLVGEEGVVVKYPIKGVFKCFVDLDNFEEGSYPFLNGEVEEI